MGVGVGEKGFQELKFFLKIGCLLLFSNSLVDTFSSMITLK